MPRLVDKTLYSPISSILDVRNDNILSLIKSYIIYYLKDGDKVVGTQHDFGNIASMLLVLPYEDLTIKECCTLLISLYSNIDELEIKYSKVISEINF